MITGAEGPQSRLCQEPSACIPDVLTSSVPWFSFAPVFFCLSHYTLRVISPPRLAALLSSLYLSEWWPFWTMTAGTHSLAILGPYKGLWKQWVVTGGGDALISPLQKYFMTHRLSRCLLLVTACPVGFRG